VGFASRHFVTFLSHRRSLAVATFGLFARRAPNAAVPALQNNPHITVDRRLGTSVFEPDLTIPPAARQH
jgi:hypothetical protein